MISLLMAAIGLGLAVSLIFSELFALSTGGMVVAGYVALRLTMPVEVGLTLAASYLTLLVVRGLSTFMIIYGRRQVAAMVLVGYLVGAAVGGIATLWGPLLPRGFGFGQAFSATGGPVYETIGFIIPGLIAIWFERQGVVATLCSLLAGAVLVRLMLIVVIGDPVAAAGGLAWTPIGGSL
jgi:gamma-polyglutamate biosynthesis protein CapC